MKKLNQSLLSELNTGIIILDASLKVKFINPSALTILDTTEKTSIGQKIDLLFVLPISTNYFEAFVSHDVGSSGTFFFSKDI